MLIEEQQAPQPIVIRPASLFAFIKIVPLLLAAAGFLLLAWRYWPYFIWPGFFCVCFALYRYAYIRKVNYVITAEIIRITTGIFFKRTDQVELYRIKDYIQTQTLLLQVFKLMDLCLKSTDPENAIIWMRGIPASHLVDILRDYVQAARQRNKIYEIN